MRFYNGQHTHYCGVDLHTKTMFVCVLDATGEVTRFDSHQQFCSYARLIRPTKTSAGKAAGVPSFKKIGNGHLTWAFSEAALVLMRESKAVKGYVERMTQKHGKGKALGILSHKLGRSLYYMLRRGQYFDEQLFLQTA